VIEDQQPLKDVVSAVLKSMKLAVEDQPTLDEFTSRQVWSQDKGGGGAQGRVEHILLNLSSTF